MTTYRKLSEATGPIAYRDLWPSMSENDLLTAILDAAKLLGWRRYHVRNSKAGIVQGDAGFPDLVLARKGRVIFAELKSERGKLTPAQLAWVDDLDVAWQLIRPSDLDDFIELLR
jgi:hypothetical protein